MDVLATFLSADGAVYTMQPLRPVGAELHLGVNRAAYGIAVHLALAHFAAHASDRHSGCWLVRPMGVRICPLAEGGCRGQ